MPFQFRHTPLPRTHAKPADLSTVSRGISIPVLLYWRQDTALTATSCVRFKGVDVIRKRHTGRNDTTSPAAAAVPFACGSSRERPWHTTHSGVDLPRFINYPLKGSDVL